MTWHHAYATCPHCGIHTTIGNINRWHGDRCLAVNPDGHEGQNSALNRPAVYINLDGEPDVRFFSSYRRAAEHYGLGNGAMFGQVIRGRRNSTGGIVPLRLDDFLRITEDELTDLLEHAREARDISQGRRGQYLKHKR